MHPLGRQKTSYKYIHKNTIATATRDTILYEQLGTSISIIRKTTQMINMGITQHMINALNR